MFGNFFSRLRTPRPRQASLAEGQRIYAVGDIHGRLDLLAKLHGLIADDAAGAPETAKTIIYLGDYIDRGLESRGVVDCLLEQPLEGITPIYLQGNHEETMMRFLDDFKVGAAWFQFGGDATLYSYGVALSGPPGEQRTLIDAQRDLRENLPEAHLAFLGGLATHHRAGDYFFAHAGVRPGVPLEAQSPRDLIWIRNDFLKSRADHGAVVVHGHSISLTVEDLPNRINIDTGAYATNILTCVALQGADYWLLQTS